MEDYDRKFNELRIDEELDPIQTQREQINAYYHKQLENNKNNYFIQAQEKSRISPVWNIETEVMGTVATERTVLHPDSMTNNKEVNKGYNPGHRRKQSANVPYKMSMPHTNIDKISAAERVNLNYKPINCHFENNNDIEDDDEEWNIGEEAEEAPEYYYNDQTSKQKQAKKWNIRISGYERNIRSNTTKSGSSSLGHYKQTDANLHQEFITEGEEDNFLTLEWDENLYEEEKLNNHLEEEKVLIHPTRIKQSFVDIQKKIKPRKDIPETQVDDTLPDFGFIKKSSQPENKLKENKIILNKKPVAGKPHKKLKIK